LHRRRCKGASRSQEILDPLIHGPGDFCVSSGAQMYHVDEMLTEIIHFFGIKFSKQINQSYVHLNSYFPHYLIPFDNMFEPNPLQLSRICKISKKSKNTVGITAFDV